MVTSPEAGRVGERSEPRWGVHSRAGSRSGRCRRAAAIWRCSAARRRGLLRELLGLEHGIPSHDTFSRVFRAARSRAFERAFQRFMAAFARANRIDLSEVVAIDGKALRGAYERGKAATPLRMVNVFATEARIALASRKAPGRNEAKGALQLLGTLSIEGSIVTVDALHCSRPFAAAVLACKADYALALKKNQSKLFDAVARRFARRGKRSVAVQRELSTHDRHECAARNYHSRHQSWCLQQLPRRRGSASHYIAPTSSGCARRTVTRALLSAVQIHACQTSPAGPAQSLGHRKPPALGPRCRPCRGRQQSQKGQCPGEPCHLAKARPQHLAAIPTRRPFGRPDQARRMGKCLPHRAYSAHMRYPSSGEG